MLGVLGSSPIARSSAAWVAADLNGTNVVETGTWPTAAVNPVTGHVGVTVTLSGSAFPATTTISATYAGAAITLSGTTTTTVGGGIPTSSPPTFTIPTTAPGSLAGAHAVVVIAGGKSAPSVTFTVTPSISLSPTSGTTGSAVTIAGSGFAAGSKLTVTFNGIAASWTSGGGSENSTVDGAVPANATIGAGTEAAGTYTVKVKDAAGHSATATYRLTN